MVANFGKVSANPNERSSVEAADKQNAKLVNWRVQLE
jgi:hypothetical protein